MSEQESIVVTGASTGIGFAIAELFTKRGWRVFGSVRKPADAERLRSAGIVPLLFDVTDPDAVAAAAAQVAAALGNRTLRGLVNNAGVAIAGPLLYLPMSQLRLQMEINFFGPAMITQAFAPLLGTDALRMGKPGRIVQMSSTAGSSAAPFAGSYAASKHALEGMSEALRREIALFGIDLSIVVAGSINTPIWEKTQALNLTQYENTPYGPALAPFGKLLHEFSKKGLPTSRVAEATWHAITARRPKLRYYVIPRKFREWTLPRLLPARMVDGIFIKMLGLGQPKRIA